MGKVRSIIGVVTGLVVWLAIATVVGLIMRRTWPAYASVAEAMTFTLPMMFARLSIGAFATISMGFVTACITQSAIARLIPGVILLIAFIPQHALLPLTYLGNRIAGAATRQRRVVALS